MQDGEKKFTLGKIYDMIDIGDFHLLCINDNGNSHTLPLKDIIYHFVPFED